MSSTAIILWLYHTDLWSEFFNLLYPISKQIHLYIGLCKENDNQNIIKDLGSFEQVTVNYYHNYGVDVAPFLQQIQYVSEPFFVKIHSKKSNIGHKNIINWRSVLLNSLVGSENILDTNISILENDSSIGMISEKNMITQKIEGQNSKIIQDLCSALGLDYKILKNDFFVMGNMFMSRTELFKKIFTDKKINGILPALMNEKGQISDVNHGTYAHSLERLFGYIVRTQKQTIYGIQPPSILIKNKDAKDGFFHLIITYNNYCYLQEDINVFGKILSKSDKTYSIEWAHMTTPIAQTYCILDNSLDTIIEKC